MSDTTREALRSSLADHVADECDGALLGAFVLAVQALELAGGDDIMHVETGGSEITQRGLAGMLGDVFTVAPSED